MSRTLTIAAATACLALAGAAHANDSVAESAAGGLVLRQTRDIDMVSEDLYVSAREIRVRYVFRNRSARAIRTIVAFPMPDRDLSQDEGMDVSWPADFATRVDGRPVAMQVEHRALLRGVDHTDLLTGFRVPVGTRDRDGTAAAGEAIRRLVPAERQRLAALGLVEIHASNDGAESGFAPRWTVRETWHWEQVFPAGRDLVVEHRYTPGSGGTVTTGLGNPEYRQSGNGREQIARYCIDAAFIGAAERIARRAGTEYATISETWISYILTTGANWRSPIGDFRLVVDKGDARNLVSFCGEGVRRISPTQFEVRRRNWRPTQDLRVLILVPHRFDE